MSTSSSDSHSESVSGSTWVTAGLCAAAAGFGGATAGFARGGIQAPPAQLRFADAPAHLQTSGSVGHLDWGIPLKSPQNNGYSVIRKAPEIWRFKYTFLGVRVPIAMVIGGRRAGVINPVLQRSTGYLGEVPRGAS
eukprot:4449870-Prymnesium_polylepis.1